MSTTERFDLTVKERLTRDLPIYLKQGNKFEVGVIRMALGEITKAEKAGKVAKELTESEQVKVLSTWADKRDETAEVFLQAEAFDRAENEKAEGAFIRGYLPEVMTDAQLATIVEKAIKETGAATVRETGVVMKAVMATEGMNVYGKKISALVRERLS